MLGPKTVKKIFADGTRWGLFTGWLIGMLLPVCSLGVIPVVRELHRCGVKRGTIVAFGLTAPLFNPMSVLYGLTLSDPIAILSFSLCALLIVTCLGLAWDRLFPISGESKEEDVMPVVGIKRSVSVLYTASKELVGPTMVYIIIGILGSITLALLLPKGYLQDQVENDNVFAPITMALIATPIYSTPLLAISQIGGMFQHGNSIGAAFSLLILGAGLNLGLLCWFTRTYGFKRVLVFVSMLMVLTVGLAYAIDKPLYPKGVEPAGHSHAFDVYTHPFGPFETQLTNIAKTKTLDFWRANEFGGTYLMCLLMVAGIAFTVAERRFDFEEWFTKSDGKETTKYDKVLPNWVIGSVAVVGLVASSVAGCYLYYPAPNDLLGDLSIVNTEAVISAKTKKWVAAEKWIAFSDDLSRRLEVGVFLRNGKVSDFQSTKAKIYRQKLDELKEYVEERKEKNIDEKAMAVADAYYRLSASFKTDDER